MRFMKLLIGKNVGGYPCLDIIPKEIRDRENVICEVTQCSCLQNDGGFSMISISDPEEALIGEITQRERYVSDVGECTIDRVSSRRLVAMVINNNCKLSKMISDSGCFLTSGAYASDGRICWNVMGSSTTHLQNLFNRLIEEGYDVKKVSTSSSNYSTLLSPKQEEALRKAMEMGYYDIPKKITTEELSKALGCAKSTLNITLRNAEKKLIFYYFLSNRDSISML